MGYRGGIHNIRASKFILNLFTLIACVYTYFYSIDNIYTMFLGSREFSLDVNAAFIVLESS